MFSIALLLFGLSASAMDDFIDQLMARMTDAEKIGQLSQYTANMATTGPGHNPEYKDLIRSSRVGSIFNAYTPAATRELQRIAVEESRLGIPLLFGYDVIHGHRTIFPIPLGEAASWNLELIEKSASIAAKEAAADGVHWTFAPMVDIGRDPRWGRIAEGSGEDVWLGSQIAAARVRGFQGPRLGGTENVMACVKHFAAYGAPLGGRDYNTVDMSERTLIETYLPPYKAAIDAGVATVMTAFNEINGVPSTSNQWLLTDLLRNIWGFTGFVVTDYTAVSELLNHGVASDLRQAARLAINAGVDMEMEGGTFNANLKSLVADGLVSQTQLDQAVRRILQAKYRLGLFSDPYRFSDEERAKRVILAPEHIAHARDMARRSFVLLKNDNQVLPLKRQGKIALIGALADSPADMLGTWSGAGEPAQAVTLLRALTDTLKDQAQLSYNDGHWVEDAVNLARRSDVVVMALGEPRRLSGEAASRSKITLPEGQTELLSAIRKTGRPVVLVLFSGRPLALEDEVHLTDAILQAWHPGTEAGHALADVLFGDYNPSGKLPVSFPVNEGQIPIFYSAKPTGRPIDDNNPYTSKYLDVSNEPLFPFGWGLSYTTFEYSNVSVSVAKPNEKWSVQVTLTNTGSRAGEETVQLYVRDVAASVTRPVKELKNFKKVFLKPGERRVVTMDLTLDDLKFYDYSMQWTAEAGEFRVMVGGNSTEVIAATLFLPPKTPMVYQ